MGPTLNLKAKLSHGPWLAVNLQTTASGLFLFGNLAELSVKFPELKQTSKDLALSLVLFRPCFHEN